MFQGRRELRYPDLSIQGSKDQNALRIRGLCRSEGCADQRASRTRRLCRSEGIKETSLRLSNREHQRSTPHIFEVMSRGARTEGIKETPLAPEKAERGQNVPTDVAHSTMHHSIQRRAN
eukprot:348503-Pelagomonas_calceolata.AAC.5